MKRIFLDTNFLMDYLIRAEYSQIASDVLKEGSQKGYRFVISFLSVANLAYINRKMPKEDLNQLLQDVITSFEVAANTFSHLHEALSLKARDYEDAIQYQTAISNGCMAIITRNTKDFPFSSIPLFTPDEFLMFLTTQ